MSISNQRRVQMTESEAESYYSCGEEDGERDVGCGLPPGLGLTAAPAVASASSTSDANSSTDSIASAVSAASTALIQPPLHVKHLKCRYCGVVVERLSDRKKLKFACKGCRTRRRAAPKAAAEPEPEPPPPEPEVHRRISDTSTPMFVADVPVEIVTGFTSLATGHGAMRCTGCDTTHAFSSKQLLAMARDGRFPPNRCLVCIARGRGNARDDLHVQCASCGTVFHCELARFRRCGSNAPGKFAIRCNACKHGERAIDTNVLSVTVARRAALILQRDFRTRRAQRAAQYAAQDEAATALQRAARCRLARRTLERLRIVRLEQRARAVSSTVAAPMTLPPPTQTTTHLDVLSVMHAIARDEMNAELRAIAHRHARATSYITQLESRVRELQAQLWHAQQQAEWAARQRSWPYRNEYPRLGGGGSK